MFVNLKKIMKSSLTDYDACEREAWLAKWQSQIVLTVSQTQWCREVTEILEGDADVIEGLKV